MINQLVERLEQRPIPALYPTCAWDSALSSLLVGTDAVSLFEESQVRDREAAEAVKAGLLLWNDSLYESHKVSQGLHNSDGSFWHAIMHRREGDHSNSKYWYSDVRAHPVNAELYSVAIAECKQHSGGDSLRNLLEKERKWNASLYVDLCAEVQRGDTQFSGLLETIQLHEIRLLLFHCRLKAVLS